MKVHCIAGVGYDSNVYLLEDADPIVVDTGTGMYAESALEELSKIVPLRSIGRIVLTHSHIDHLGGAARFQKATGAKVLLHEEEARLLMAGDTRLTLAGMFGMRLERMEIEPLSAGQKLATGSAELEVLHTPGHSPGSIVLLDRPTASAIVGDTVFTDGGVGRWDLPGGDLGALASSLRMLGTLGLRNIYPGHGPYAEGDAPRHLRLAAKYIEEGCR